MKTLTLGPFLGINTRRPEFALSTDAGSYLRAADNVDITTTGHIVRRRGLSRLQATGNAHSLMMTTDTTGFLVRASALYAITLPAYTETLLHVLTSDATMSYEQVESDWYFSNGVDIGRVNAGVVYPIGLPPMSAPSLSAIGGGLLAGSYQVAIAYLNNATGEEGALSDIAYRDLPTTGGLRVALPGAQTGATHVNVYLSESNGTVQMLHSTVTAATTSIDLTTLATGRPATGRSDALLPPGTLFYANGRLCSHSGNMVYVGLPFKHGYYLPLSGFIPFPETVTIAVCNQNGTYIAADKTYFIPGDLGDVQGQIRDVLPCGAVPGTVFKVPHQPLVGWFSKRGFVVADTDGGINTTMSDAVDVTPPEIGFANVMDQGGFRRVSGCGYSMNLGNFAATTYSDWGLTSASRVYGTKIDGIYQINTADAANSTVNLGKVDFGSEYIKAMPAVYVGSSSSDAIKLRIKAGSDDYTYTARSYGVALKENRIDPGKGLRANWSELELSNTAGCDFTIASVSSASVNTSRRI